MIESCILLEELVKVRGSIVVGVLAKFSVKICKACYVCCVTDYKLLLILCAFSFTLRGLFIALIEGLARAGREKKGCGVLLIFCVFMMF
ncbi:MAG: hypothetical protein ACTJLM_04290 [Ehrlichia sp.]